MQILIMGVMNITPDSFSDGGLTQSKEAIISRLHELSGECDVIDFGAESTAPMNPSVGEKEERTRLSVLLDGLKETAFLKDFGGSISLDSFRTQNVKWFFEQYLSLGGVPEKFIWNDVSGKFDFYSNDLYALGAETIFCHNEAIRREMSGQHMDFVVQGEILSHLHAFFQKVKSLNPHFIFDPCFGFSKTYEQNLCLLRHWGELAKAGESWVFGVSKKSFVRRFWQENEGAVGEFSREFSREELLEKSESLHLQWLKEAVRQGAKIGLKRLFLRVHDPKLALLAKQTYTSS